MKPFVIKPEHTACLQLASAHTPSQKDELGIGSQGLRAWITQGCPCMSNVDQGQRTEKKVQAGHADSTYSISVTEDDSRGGSLISRALRARVRGIVSERAGVVKIVPGFFSQNDPMTRCRSQPSDQRKEQPSWHSCKDAGSGRTQAERPKVHKVKELQPGPTVLAWALPLLSYDAHTH